MVEVKPIGIDVTESIYDRMDKLEALLDEGDAPGIDLDDEVDEEELILTSSVLEAVTMYQEGHGRGFLLQDFMGPMQAWYIAQGDQKEAITRLRPDTRRKLAGMLAGYDPETEAILVALTRESMHCMQINLVGLVRAEFRHKRQKLQIPDRLDLPPGVQVHKSQQSGQVIYEFNHERMGFLGRVVMSGYGAGHMRYQVDAAPDPLSHPYYQPKLELLQEIIAEMEPKFFGALGYSPAAAKTAGVADRVEAAKLYASFVRIPHDFEMAQFFLRLSEAQIEMVKQAAEDTLPRLSYMDAMGLRQRLAELEKFQSSPPDISPIAQALYDYLQLDDEADARAYLVEHADVLLTAEAETVLAEFFGERCAGGSLCPIPAHAVKACQRGAQEVGPNERPCHQVPDKDNIRCSKLHRAPDLSKQGWSRRA